jgi:xanthine dehydrogenase accessory factor
MESLSLSAVLGPAAQAQQSGAGAVVVTVVTDRSSKSLAPGTRLFVPEASSTLGAIHPDLDPLLTCDARQSLAERRSGLRSYRFTAGGIERVKTGKGDVDVFFEVLSRPPRLVVVGAGHIAVPLARIARLLEYHVVVLDDRPEYANRDRFPDADEILVGPYRETLSGVALDSDTHIVLVTRGHVHDQACLEEVLEKQVAYIGMIGSKRRVRTVMQHAKQNGHDPSKLRRVHAPIGLDIGAHTPGEIAVAIMAEIINVRREGPALSLALGERLNV